MSFLCHRVAQHALQFQGDVLHDVAEPGSFLHTADEPAGDAIAAAMARKAGQQANDVIGKSGQLVCRERFKGSEVDLDPDHWRHAVKMRSAEHAGVHDTDAGAKTRGVLMNFVARHSPFS